MDLNQLTGIVQAVCAVSLETAKVYTLTPSTVQTLYTASYPVGISYLTIHSLVSWSDSTVTTSNPLVHPQLKLTMNSKTSTTVQMSNPCSNGFTYSCSSVLTVPVDPTQNKYVYTIELLTNSTVAQAGTRTSNVQILGLDVIYQY